MSEFWSTQLEFFVRVIVAAVLGGLIGYERTNRGKGAGIRTHLIVAIASSLMVIISKYGFADLAENLLGTKGADPSRIAAQVVSGVGFLGAGMIYFSKNTPKGLTTAAGIWATAGIGMAIGAGMYVIGLLTAAVIFASQIMLHKNLKILQTPNDERFQIVTDGSKEATDKVQEFLSQRGFEVDEIGFKTLPDGKLEITVSVIMPLNFSFHDILTLSEPNSGIVSINTLSEK